MQKKVFITSLGCSKNFVDTEVMTASLMLKGISFTNDINDADIILINTCAFIQSARDETIEEIEAAIEWKNDIPGRKIIVGGCIVQWDKDKSFRNKYHEVDLWTGIDESKDLGDIFISLYDDEEFAHIANTDATYLYNDSTPRLQLTPQHFAYIKISDGCKNNCTYCSIPSIRGDLRSRSIESVVNEAKNFIEQGVSELILIGQDLTAFANDNDSGESLTQLLLELDKIADGVWIRLMYAHPASFSDDLIEVMKNAKNILPYIDLPLQHISDNILKKMNRKVTRSDIEKLLIKIRTIPDIVIRTTFIVGFPGETEEEFQELYDFVKKERFDRLGVFGYSKEEAVPANKMGKFISQNIIDKRHDAIMELQAEISLEKNKALIDKELDVLIDAIDEERVAIGRTYMDAPDIDNIVYFNIMDLNEITPGYFIPIIIDEVSEYDLNGYIS